MGQKLDPPKPKPKLVPPMPKRSLLLPDPPMPNGSLPALPLPAAPNGLLAPAMLNPPLVPSADEPPLGFVFEVAPPAFAPPFALPPPSTITGPTGPLGAPITGPRSVSAPQANAHCASVAHSAIRAHRSTAKCLMITPF